MSSCETSLRATKNGVRTAQKARGIYGKESKIQHSKEIGKKELEEKVKKQF